MPGEPAKRFGTTYSAKILELMDLPPELRLWIHKILFFGSEEDDYAYSVSECSSFIRASLHTAYDTIFNIHPYRWRTHRPRRKFDLAIFRTNRTIQAEAKPIFYGLASFNLIGARVFHGSQSWQFLSKLTPRYRKLGRRVEALCFTGHPVTYFHSRFTSLDWTLSMKILAQECTALQSLKLWVEERNFAAVARSNETDAWIQEILRLRGLKDFEMPALVPKHTQYLHEQHLQSTSKVLPLLQSRLLQSNYEAPSDSLQRSPKISQAGGSFPFLKFPPEARALVYRHALLPANKRVHPYVEP